jgi:putative copper resistance protein D
LNGLLIALRAVHFASSMVLAGTITFAVVVVGQASWHPGVHPQLNAWREQMLRLAWVGLATAVLSGAAWLVVLAADIGALPVGDVLSSDLVWRVLTRTRFGIDWIARLVVAFSLVGGLIIARHRGASPRWLGATLATLALLFLGSLAWAGHAAGTPGSAGLVHVTADALHLVAGGIWIGGLASLALLFAAAHRAVDPTVARVARAATLRFSTLGVIAVGTILATGLLNTYVLAGSVPALMETDYGHLLLLKIGLFIAMVCIAAFNRLRLMPRLSSARTGVEAQRHLQRNTLIEAAMALLILVIVGALGTLPPGLHALPAAHVHGG